MAVTFGARAGRVKDTYAPGGDMKKIAAVLLLMAGAAAQAGAATRVLTTELMVQAPAEKAWRAWTTAKGVKSFFAPGCNVELRVDGLYEILFAPEAQPGERGAEGQRVLEFEPVGAGRTRVRFTHLGWGEGESWDQAYNYFDRAWNEVVLPRFRYAMEVGPIDWKK